jgi:outer membrane protein assembly factor BamB
MRLCCVLAVLPACALAQAWANVHGMDQASRRWQGARAPLSGAKRWNQTLFLAGEAPDSHVAVAGDGRVIVMDDHGEVQALSGLTGAVLWSEQLGGTVEAASPCITNDGLFYAATNTSIEAIQLSNGSPLWSVQLDASLRPVKTAFLATSGNTLLASLAANNTACAVLGMDRRTGDLLWRRDGACQDLVVTSDHRAAVSSPATLIASGELVWQSQNHGMSASECGGMLLVSHLPGLWVFNASTGAILSTHLELLVATQTTWFPDCSVALQFSSGEVARVDVASWQTLWNKTVCPAGGFSTSTGPVVSVSSSQDDEEVYVPCSNGTVVVLSSGGDTRWVAAVGTYPGFPQLAVAPDGSLIALNDDTIVSFASNGTWPSASPTPTATPTPTQTATPTPTATHSMSPSASASPKPTLSGGEVAGIAMGSLVGVLAIGAGWWYWRRVRRSTEAVATAHTPLLK